MDRPTPSPSPQSAFRYDPDLLRKLARQTQRQATAAWVGGIVAGSVTGLLFGYAAMLMFATPVSLLVPGGIAGGVMGIVVGRRKAMALQLQAQMALCQVEIEENTRQASGQRPGRDSPP